MRIKSLNISEPVRIALISGIFLIIGGIISGIFLLLQPQPQQSVVINVPTSVISDLPEIVPTITPKPTVVGTPITGHELISLLGIADLGVRGKVGDTISANNIALVVDEVNIYSITPDGVLFYPGYNYVIAKIRVANGSGFSFSAYDFWLADEFNNLHANSSTYLSKQFNLQEFPTVRGNETGTGALIFQVPEVALPHHLKLTLLLINRYTSELSTLFEVDFGDALTIETPMPTTQP